MRIARFTTGDDPRYGFIQSENGKDYIAVLSGDPLYTPIAPTGERVELGDGVRLLSPIIPRSKVIGVGRNYADHAKEMGNELPTYEAELAIVIGRLTKDVSPEQARKYILGYTIANDVTARDAQRNDGQWARAKGFDSSCPIGPWIDTDVKPEDLVIQSHVNGELKQDGNTADMIFDPYFLVSYISEAFTLLPGDVILTGTPAGVGKIDHGDRVECSVEGLGVLSNPVVRRSWDD